MDGPLHSISSSCRLAICLITLTHLPHPASSLRVSPRSPGSKSAWSSFSSATSCSFGSSLLITGRRTRMTTGDEAAGETASGADGEIRVPFRWERVWSEGLKKGDMWDAAVVSPALQNLLDSGVLPKGRALVPGCGRGYEAVAFGKSGYDVIGIDLAPSGIEAARELLAEQEGVSGVVSGKAEFRTIDFFDFTPSEHGKFDVILDYTFLCALDPTFREAWAEHMVSLLNPDGELVTLVFPIVDKEGGPPFAMSESLVSGLLEPRGLRAVQLEKLSPELCHKGREGKTALGRWRFSTTT